MSGSESSVSGGCPPRRLPASALACWIGLLAASFPAVAPAAASASAATLAGAGALLPLLL